METSSEEDIVGLLTQQHRRLERLLETLAEAESAPERRELLGRAGDELVVHLLAEEEIVYPRVHKARTEDILLESLEEHLSLKRLLADLLALAPGELHFQAKCKVLHEQARHHHGEEEAHLFPAMRQLLGTEARREMGEAVRRREAQLRAAGQPRGRVDGQTGAAASLP